MNLKFFVFQPNSPAASTPMKSNNTKHADDDDAWSLTSSYPLIVEKLFLLSLFL